MKVRPSGFPGNRKQKLWPQADFAESRPGVRTFWRPLGNENRSSGPKLILPSQGRGSDLLAFLWGQKTKALAPSRFCRYEAGGQTFWLPLGTENRSSGPRLILP